MNKLTRDSLITGLPMPIKLQESCEEIACMQVCEQYVYNSCKGCPVQECMTKLAAYEDTGLEPEEVKHLSASDASKEESSIKYYNEMRKYRDELKYYKKLEEQGLLIKLPCKVGDKVYTIFCDKVYEKTIDKIIINRFTTPQIWVETKLSFATSSLERWDIVIGKTVFLTREEAEKVLEATDGERT